MSEYVEYTSFVKRTKKIVNDYKGDLDASILVNCSIGLLFVAKEKYGDILSKVKNPSTIRQWGVDVDRISCFKRYNAKTKKVENAPKTLSALCRHMRNSFAHCNFKPVNVNHKIIGYKLYDYYLPQGDKNHSIKTFYHEIQLKELKMFLNQVSDYILRNKSIK